MSIVTYFEKLINSHRAVVQADGTKLDTFAIPRVQLVLLGLTLFFLLCSSAFGLYKMHGSSVAEAVAQERDRTSKASLADPVISRQLRELEEGLTKERQASAQSMRRAEALEAEIANCRASASVVTSRAANCQAVEARLAETRRERDELSSRLERQYPPPQGSRPPSNRGQLQGYEFRPGNFQTSIDQSVTIPDVEDEQLCGRLCDLAPSCKIASFGGQLAEREWANSCTLRFTLSVTPRADKGITSWKK
jgi:hypothetical protein